MIFNGLAQVMIENEDVELNQHGDSSEEMSSNDSYMYKDLARLKRPGPDKEASGSHASDPSHARLIQVVHITQDIHSTNKIIADSKKKKIRNVKSTS